MIISHHISSFPNIKITQAEGAVPNLCCLQPGGHHLYHEVDGYGDDHDHDLDHEYDDVGDDCDKHDNDDGDGNSLAVQHLGLHLLWYLDPISPAVPDNHHDDDNQDDDDDDDNDDDDDDDDGNTPSSHNSKGGSSDDEPDDSATKGHHGVRFFTKNHFMLFTLFLLCFYVHTFCLMRFALYFCCKVYVLDSML